MTQRSIIYMSLLFFLGSVLPNSCYSQTIDSNSTEISFCSLPKYEGKTVVVDAVYSGVDEYWGLNAKAKCKEVRNVELDYFKDGRAIPAQFQALFDSVHSVYWNQYLVLKLKGRFDSSNPNGYGHLGSNSSRFIVEEVIDAKLIKRTKQKRLTSASQKQG